MAVVGDLLRSLYRLLSVYWLARSVTRGTTGRLLARRAGYRAVRRLFR